MQNVECRMQNKGICFADNLIISEQGVANAKLHRFTLSGMYHRKKLKNYAEGIPQFCILHSHIPLHFSHFCGKIF